MRAVELTNSNRFTDNHFSSRSFDDSNSMIFDTLEHAMAFRKEMVAKGIGCPRIGVVADGGEVR